MAASLHLFDAKCRVRARTDVGLAAHGRNADDEKVAERAGSFNRADIYKMHAYGWGRRGPWPRSDGRERQRVASGATWSARGIGAVS